MSTYPARALGTAQLALGLATAARASRLATADWGPYPGGR